MHWEAKNFMWLTVCNSCFIVVVWNQTHNISEVCLYIYIYIYIYTSQVALVVNNLPASAGIIRDTGSVRRSGRSPGGGHGNPLQYSCLENPMDRGAWWATVHGVAKSWTWLKQLSTHTCTCAHTNTYTHTYFMSFMCWMYTPAETTAFAIANEAK